MPCDHVVLARQHVRPVQLRLAHAVDAVFVRVLQVVPHLRRKQHRLGRNASPQQARPAQPVVRVHQRHLQPILRRANRKRISRRPAAHHHRIKDRLRHAHSHPPQNCRNPPILRRPSTPTPPDTTLGGPSFPASSVRAGVPGELARWGGRVGCPHHATYTPFPTHSFPPTCATIKSATSARAIRLPPRGSASPSTRYFPRAFPSVSIGGITIVQSNPDPASTSHCSICDATAHFSTVLYTTRCTNHRRHAACFFSESSSAPADPSATIRLTPAARIASTISGTALSS